MRALLGSILYTPIFYIGSAIIAIGIALGAFSRRWVLFGSHVWSAWFVGCARIFLGIRIVVRGNIPQEGAIVALKHTSMLETILTLYLWQKPAVVMKQELRRVPVWGFAAAQHGSIFVARDKGGIAMRNLLRESRSRMKEGRPILLFPEGTRVPLGETPPLRGGLSGMYGLLGVPVVPVAHNAGLLWGRGFVKKPGIVTLAFREDVPPGLPKEEMEARVHAAINTDPTQGAVR